MNITDILDLTKIELEAYLNTVVSSVTYTSEDPRYVKNKMIEAVKNLFIDSDVIVRETNVYGNKFALQLGRFSIDVKVAAKGTGELIKITKLRKKEVKKADKFKIDNFIVRIPHSLFEVEDLNEYKVRVSTTSSYGDIDIMLIDTKGKLKDMLTKEKLMLALSEQNDQWSNIKANLILEAAQPMIKDQSFKPDFNQKKWDDILAKTAEVNEELLETTLNKMFVYDNPEV